MGEFAIRPASPIARRQLARARVVVVALLLSPVVMSACKSGKQNVSEGKAIEQKGNVEVHAGNVTGSDTKKADGQADEIKGKIQQAVGKAQETADSALNKAAKH